MKTQNIAQFLSKILLAVFIVSLFACSSKRKPAAEIYSNEPVVTNNTYYEPPSSESVSASTDQSTTVESSGIAAPAEENTFSEPPVHDMAMLDSTTEMTPEPEATPDMTDTMATNISETPADYFAVQVVASSTIENLNAFATKYSLSNELTAQVTVNNKTWNVLLLGTYATLEQAKEALAGIQDKVDTSPWIRSVGSLQ